MAGQRNMKCAGCSFHRATFLKAEVLLIIFSACSLQRFLQEFAGGGDLWSFIDANSGRLTERVTVSLVLQPFLRAVHYLHTAGIAHRYRQRMAWHVMGAHVGDCVVAGDAHKQLHATLTLWQGVIS
jgi:hypothetical protein